MRDVPEGEFTTISGLVGVRSTRLIGRRGLLTLIAVAITAVSTGVSACAPAAAKGPIVIEGWSDFQ